MAMLFMEGFPFGTAVRDTAAPVHWYSEPGGTTTTIDGVSRMVGYDGGDISVPALLDSGVVGTHFNASVGYSYPRSTIIRASDYYIPPGSKYQSHFTVSTGSDYGRERHLALYYGQPSTSTTYGTLLAETSTPVVTPGVVQFLEVKFRIAATGGYVTVRLNGQEILNYTGNTVWAGAAPQTNLVYVGYPYSPFWDVYLCDLTGTVANDFLGEGQITNLYPAQDVLGDWTPSTPGDHYPLMVDDGLFGGYLDAETPGLRELYKLSPQPPEDPLAVTVTQLGRQRGPSAPVTAPIVRDGAGAGTPLHASSALPGPSANEFGGTARLLPTQPNAQPWTRTALTADYGFESE